MNLVNHLLNIEANRVMNDIFDTFSKNTLVRFYKTARAVVSVMDSDYNIHFPDNSNITYEAQYQDFQCRVIYLDKQTYASILDGSSDAGIRSKQYYNRIKIQVKSSGFEYLKDTEKFVFYDEEYKVSEPWRRLGLLKDDQLYQIILERII